MLFYHLFQATCFVFVSAMDWRLEFILLTSQEAVLRNLRGTKDESLKEL